MNAQQAKGRNLEQEIAHFLSANGYAVRANVVEAGRSGASHELDVVGDKSDGLTTFRLVVECKAWSSPIDKDVVFKLSGVLSDLGAAKGVIASLSGWTVQAQQTAAQQHIELWGPQELASRLGSAAVDHLRRGPAPTSAAGLPFAIPQDVAVATIQRICNGRFGLNRETVTWVGPLFVSTLQLQIALTSVTGVMSRVPRTSRVWNTYDGMSGSFMVQTDGPPPTVPIDISCGHIDGVVTRQKIEAAMHASHRKWHEVKTPQAKERHLMDLMTMGIRRPVAHLAVEASAITYLPAWVAFLRKGMDERIIALDGITGKERRSLSTGLTANALRVRAALGAR